MYIKRVMVCKVIATHDHFEWLRNIRNICNQCSSCNSVNLCISCSDLGAIVVQQPMAQQAEWRTGGEHTGVSQPTEIPRMSVELPSSSAKGSSTGTTQQTKLKGNDGIVCYQAWMPCSRQSLYNTSRVVHHGQGFALKFAHTGKMHERSSYEWRRCGCDRDTRAWLAFGCVCTHCQCDHRAGTAANYLRATRLNMTQIFPGCVFAQSMRAHPCANGLSPCQR